MRAWAIEHVFFSSFFCFILDSSFTVIPTCPTFSLPSASPSQHLPPGLSLFIFCQQPSAPSPRRCESRQQHPGPFVLFLSLHIYILFHYHHGAISDRCRLVRPNHIQHIEARVSQRHSVSHGSQNLSWKPGSFRTHGQPSTCFLQSPKLNHDPSSGLSSCPLWSSHTYQPYCGCGRYIE